MGAHRIPPMLGKLIPRLGSPRDAEVVATARAIERVLKSADLDLHDLNAAITAASPVGPSASAWPQPPRSPSDPPRWQSLDPAMKVMALDYILDAPYLTAWEREFTRHIHAVLQTRPHTSLTAKQVEVLDRLLAKIWGEP